MKVLWYCNVLLPKAAEAAKIKGEINTAVWIEGFLNQIWSDYKWLGGRGVLGPPRPAAAIGRHLSCGCNRIDKSRSRGYCILHCITEIPNRTI